MAGVKGILAHRGFWLLPEEKNSLGAFERALEHGFGIELDVRDCQGRLAVSHDLPGVAAVALNTVLERIAEPLRASRVPLAINVKSDGLESLLQAALQKYKLLDRSFLFDMSVPSMVAFSRAGAVQMATRHSEYEPHPVMLPRCSHVWVDSFEGDWDDLAIFAESRFAGKQLAFVSPELHGRNPMLAWARLRESPLEFFLCTDRPMEARRFFQKGVEQTHGTARHAPH